MILSASLYGQNVLISTLANPNEPCILMDPLRPNVIMAATNLNNYYLSQDTGRTWSVHQLTSSYGVWGDPTLAVDTAGNFYFFHLSNPSNGNWIDRIVCQKTTDDGNTWSDGTYTGLNGTKAQDKEWPVIDRNTNDIYLTWTQFDAYGSSLPTDSSLILFSKSTDNGLSWTTPKRINKHAGDCIDSDNTVEGAVPAVGPSGEIYVAWAGPNGLVFNKSLDTGETWLDEEIAIDPMPTGWDYLVPGILRANGLPVTVCDLSEGSHHGAIYVNWSDQRNGAEDTDVWLSKSIDGGETWSTPARVNDDMSNRHQFFTWMTIDQTTGYLYFIFYDRRNTTGSLTDVYMAISQDGGETFINRKISESSFQPNQNIFFGDYTNITVHNGIVRPIWTRLHNGQLSIWTHLTSQEELITALPENESTDDAVQLQTYPNPTDDYFYVSFTLRQYADVNIIILDREGRIVSTPLHHVKKGYGKYIEKIDLDTLQLPPGQYFVHVEIDGQKKTVSQIVIDP